MPQPKKVKARKGGEIVVDEEVKNYEDLYYALAQANSISDADVIDVYFEDASGEYIRDTFRTWH